MDVTIPKGVRRSMTTADRDFYTFEEMAVLLDIEPGTLSNRLSQSRGHPPVKTVGGKHYFPKALFRKWLETGVRQEAG